MSSLGKYRRRGWCSVLALSFSIVATSHIYSWISIGASSVPGNVGIGSLGIGLGPAE